MYIDVAKNYNSNLLEFPQTIVPSPIDIDYKNGFIRRYFCRMANDSSGHIFEIDKDIYIKQSKNAYWIVCEIKWRIAGPINTTYDFIGNIDDIGVINANKAAITRASQKVKNIGLYLPNILQFHK
jgi:hypothetical protein